MQGLRMGFFVLLATLAIASAVPIAHAANGPSALQPGAWSVELALDIDDSNDPFGAVAFKRNMGERSALRIGVGSIFNADDQEGTAVLGPGLTSDFENWSQVNGWAVFLHYVRYGAISERVATQLGVGPVIQVQRISTRNSFDVGTPSFQEGETTQELKLYGLEVMLGVEWFFTSRFSLGGQAGLRASTGDTETHQVLRTGDGPTYAITRTDRSGDTTRIETNPSRIVLTGYF
jgi:hypothetical protein